MSDQQKHPYDKTGHFLAWTTSTGFAVEPAERPGAIIEVASEEAQMALRWGIEAGIAAAERAAHRRYQLQREHELKAYQRKIAVMARQLGLEREPLAAFRVESGGATYWVAAKDECDAAMQVLRDDQENGDLEEALSGAIEVRRLTDEEATKIRIRDDADEDEGEQGSTLLEWVTDLNAQKAPAMICACSEW